MTDYNGEQNNIIGMAQPTNAQPINPTEPQAAEAPVESQIAVSEAPTEYISAEEPATVSAEAPVQIQPTAPVNQAPVILPTAPQPPKNSKAPIFIGIGIFLVGVIVALILVFVLVGNNDEDEKSKGNKTETEQTEDKPSSEDDNDEDEDNKDDDEDKNNTDKGNSDKDTSSKDDKTDKGDKDDKDDKNDKGETDVNAPVAKGYTEYLDAFGNVFCGDFKSFEALLPDAIWNLMRYAYTEDFGHLPSSEEVLDYLFGEAPVGAGADYATYVVLEENEVDAQTIQYLQEGLQEVFILDEIEEAYEIRVAWTIGVEDEVVEFEDTAYAVCFDGEWTLMSKNYMLYVTDTESVNDVFAGVGESFI